MVNLNIPIGVEKQKFRKIIPCSLDHVFVNFTILRYYFEHHPINPFYGPILESSWYVMFDQPGAYSDPAKYAPIMVNAGTSFPTRSQRSLLSFGLPAPSFNSNA